jgi:membrane-bound inhibitor of C-type lysozyme
MKISFTRVTWYSQLAAIILFVVVWYVGFCVGRYWVSPYRQGTGRPLTGAVAAATFVCETPTKGFISSVFYKDRVNLILSDGRQLTVPHAISADGARYANANESFVFWNKGNTAFIQEQGTTTYAGCATK